MSLLTYLKSSWSANEDSIPENELLFTADVQLEAKQDKPATVSILAYTGGIMSPPSWGPVVIDLAGLDIAASFPLLVDHNSSLEGVVGHGTAQVVNGKLISSGTITRSMEAAQKIIDLNKDGFRWQASVGVSPIKVERIQAGKSISANSRTHTAPDGGMWLIKSGKLREITITALGADDQTDVSIAASMGAEEMNLAANATLPTDTDSVLKAERERVKKIEDLCNGMEGAQVKALKAKAMADEISIETLQASLLDVIRASRPTAPGSGVSDDPDFSNQHVEACLLIRAGYEQAAIQAYGDRVVNQAGEIRHKSLIELAAMMMQAKGHNVPRDRSEMLRASISTLSLPVALGNTVNRALIQVYKETPATWRSIASIRDANNFKEHTSIRPSFVGQVEKVGAAGELKHGTMGENTIPWYIDTYGKQFTVTRQSVINDDLNFLDEATPAMAKAAMRQLSDLVWSTVLSNPGSFFSSGNNNNQSGGGSALSLSSLETAVKQMRKQRDAEYNDLDIKPVTLVVSPDLEVTAKNILRSIEIQAAEGSPTGNALKDIVNLEVEPRISNTDKFTGASTTQWYLFAGPIDVPMIVGFLMGMQSPTTEFVGLDHDINKLAMGWRCYHDFGFAMGDEKACQKSVGA